MSAYRSAAPKVMSSHLKPLTGKRTASRKTVDQPVVGEPLKGLDGTGSMPKPGELIDVVEMTPLTLADRRTWNLLIANAWDRIKDHTDYEIPKAVLRGSHESNDRLEDTIK